jgi:hypothetical protein
MLLLLLVIEVWVDAIGLFAQGMRLVSDRRRMHLFLLSNQRLLASSGRPFVCLGLLQVGFDLGGSGSPPVRRSVLTILLDPSPTTTNCERHHE